MYERPDQKEWQFGGHVTEDGRYLIISVPVVLVSSHWVLSSAVDMARIFGISESVLKRGMVLYIHRRGLWHGANWVRFDLGFLLVDWLGRGRGAAGGLQGFQGAVVFAVQKGAVAG